MVALVAFFFFFFFFFTVGRDGGGARPDKSLLLALRELSASRFRIELVVGGVGASGSNATIFLKS